MQYFGALLSSLVTNYFISFFNFHLILFFFAYFQKRKKNYFIKHLKLKVIFFSTNQKCLQISIFKALLASQLLCIKCFFIMNSLWGLLKLCITKSRYRQKKIIFQIKPNNWLHRPLS